MQPLGGIVKSGHRAYAPTVQSENGRSGHDATISKTFIGV